jgi:ABC-type antimicrobial peptide transport system permease subunit
VLDPQARSWTLGATLFSAFGVLALLVAAVGLYSVLAFDVAQRTRELGIRTALGAEKLRLLCSVLASGLTMAGSGVALGVVTSLAIAPRVDDLLYAVSPRDPFVFSVVVGTLLATALFASLVPALRATRVDPMVALRSD